MKLGPVIKIDKKNKGRSKKADDDVMLKKFEVIVIFLNFFLTHFRQGGGGNFAPLPNHLKTEKPKKIKVNVAKT